MKLNKDNVTIYCVFLIWWELKTVNNCVCNASKESSC